MSELKTLVGACGAPVNSGRAIQSASFTVSIEYEANYQAPNFHTVSIKGVAAQSWGRVPFPNTIRAPDDTPGDNLFYVAQECCCRCRAAFIFGDQTFNTVPDTCGIVVARMEMETSDQAYNEDGTADGDPQTDVVTRFPFVQLWNKRDAPCRKKDGKNLSIVPASARLFLPAEPFGVVGDKAAPPEEISLVVTGTNGFEEDGEGAEDVSGYKAFHWTKPNPCSDAIALEGQIVKTWGMDDVDASLKVTIAFTMS